MPVCQARCVRRPYLSAKPLKPGVSGVPTCLPSVPYRMQRVQGIKGVAHAEVSQCCLEILRSTLVIVPLAAVNGIMTVDL